ALNQWVPKLRGFLVATVLGITPLALMFVATPLVFRTLALIFGLFAWLAVWGISDAVSVQMAQDAAADAFSQIKMYQMGYEAIMNTPDGAVQALGVFGKARTMALMLATVLSAALFKFGGHAFTSLASSWQNDLGQAGEAAGQHTMQPDQSARAQQSYAEVPGSIARPLQTGFDNVAGATAQAGVQSGYAFQARRDYVSAQLAGGTTIDYWNRREAEMAGGSAIGTVQGGEAVARNRGSNLFEASRESQTVQTERSGVGALETRDAGREIFGGDGVAPLAAFQAKQSVASAGAERDLARRFGGTGEDLSQLRPLEQQKVNETGAAIDASGADVSRDLGMRTVGARERLAGAERLDSFARGPERVG
ncbi:MAG: conjugal transfer protein TraG N-terminal domain-containing protein, partial [Nevskiales bacterium]